MTKDLLGGSRIDWVSLLEKHKESIPFVVALFEAVVFFEDQIHQYFFDAETSTLYSQVNNC